MSWTCSACGKRFETGEKGKPVIRAYVDLGGRSVTLDAWAVDDQTGDRWVVECRHEQGAASPCPRWRLEKRGDVLVSCSEYLVTRQEMEQGFGPEVARRFFAPGDTEKVVTLEMPIPICPNLGAITDRMVLAEAEA